MKKKFKPNGQPDFEISVGWWGDPPTLPDAMGSKDYDIISPLCNQNGLLHLLKVNRPSTINVKLGI